MRRLLAAAALAALALPAAASAHVTIAPDSAAPGYRVEAFRVPNEDSSAVTTKIQVKLPDGFASARPAVVDGWTSKLTTGKLAKPVQTEDGPIDTGVAQITWTADSKAAGIPANTYRDFPVELLIGAKPGAKLTFKALQTYTGGKVVRWIGAPDSDQPAPVLTVASAGAATAATAGATATATPADGLNERHDPAGADNGLAVVAIVLAGLALLVALAAAFFLKTPKKESA